MKKHLPGFLAGLTAAVLVFALAIPALAETGAIGTIEFNTVGLTKNGEPIFYPEEDYLLENGYSIPSSVLFTDPTGNSTTYLSVRRLAELLEVEIIWNGPDGTVEVNTTPPPVPSPSPTPSPAPVISIP